MRLPVYLVVRHTMQALPLRSMQKTICNEHKTRPRWKSPTASGVVFSVLLFWLLASFGTSLAQTATAGQPPTASHALASGQAAARKPEVGTKATETLVDSSIPDDTAIEKLLVPYKARVKQLDTVIGTLAGDLNKAGMGGGSLGNFVSDGLRAEASTMLGRPVPLAITNSGGLRKNSIAQGKLRVKDIFELLPFENALIQIDLTGEQVLQLLKSVLKGRDAQSGARITYRLDADQKPELVSAKLVDAAGKETELDPKKIYSVVTIDYLYGLKSGNYALLREGKNVRPIGITMRDAMLKYLRSQGGHPILSKLDGRFLSVDPASTREAWPND